MPIVKKIKLGGEALEVDKITRTIRKELALRSLTYINPMIARGILADEISNKVSSLMKKIMITRKMEKLGKTRLGRSYINNVVINLVKKYGAEKTEVYGAETSSNPKLKIIRRELKKLYNNHNVKGVDYIQAIREIIHKHFDPKTAKKIDKELMIRINMLELGKKGLVDFIDGRTFYKTNNKPVNFKKYSLDEVHKAMDTAGIKKTKRDYYEMKVARIMVEAIRTSKSHEEAITKFEKLYYGEREIDTLFRIAEFNAVLRYFVDMYNKSTIMNVSEKVLTTIPNRLVKMSSRLLASAYRMIPIVGSIAATNVEAAEAVAEIGESISAKVENSAYMYYNLKDLVGDKIPLSYILEEQARRNQTAA